jgi:membrane peptidoglycan carboxypeptidase
MSEHKKSRRKNIDLEKPRKIENIDLEEDTSIEIPKNKTTDFSTDSEAPMLALPSEFSKTNVDHLFIEDGYYKEKDARIIKKGSKVNNGLNSQNSQNTNKEKSFIGRKNSQSWSANITDLRKKFGFSWGSWARKISIFILVFGIFSITTVTTVAAVAIDYWKNTPSIDRLDRDPSQNSVLYARDGKTKIYEFYKEEKREVIDNINDVPLAMQLAIVSLEDENYWDPSNETGIPWKNLAGAARDCLLSGGDNCRGASGISQQLIKNISDDRESNLNRKVRELFIAVKLNQGTSKTDILLKYMNWVPFGRNAYGVQEASKAYFGKKVNVKDTTGKFTLTAPEACYLAAMIQSPTYYESGIPTLPAANLEKSKAPTAPTETLASSKDLEVRKDACLTKLHELNLPLEDGTFGNYIKTKQDLENLQKKPVISTSNNSQAEEARKQDFVAFVTTPVDDPFPHFREYAREELKKFLTDDELFNGGYEITTSIDPGTQRENERILTENEDLIKSVGGNNASSMIVDGPTGQIISMVGSLGYNREDIKGKVNVATTLQQPGSSIKPYVYAAAFANGFNPGTVLLDVKTSWQGYEPKNFDGNFRGPVTMRRALQGSLNIPAVKSLFLDNDQPASDQVSKLDTFFSFTESLGVQFPCAEGAGNDAFIEKNKGVETCVPNAVKGITQADIDSAYRGRCFIASALGGCETTLVSHISGFNTLLQQKRITATPFISIKKRSTGKDIYAEKQASEKPVYIVRDLDENAALVARQTANVMADYQARVSEFGSTRFNLELDNKNWKVAAKTGTSNGPKDFWTMGGSPYYTVGLWAGRTDNEDMSANASAGVSVARIWKQIMESVHADKEVKNFSTEGLKSYFVPAGSNKTTDKDGKDTQKSAGGQAELLTPKQIEQLNKKSGVVGAITSKEDLENVKKNTIFNNRTALIPGSFSINKLDNKLFVEGQTAEENRQKIDCTYLIPEFPDSNWSTPVEQYAKAKNDAYCNLPEPSTLVGVPDPSFVTNFAENTSFPNSSLQVSASFPTNSSRTVSQIKIYLNGTLEATGSGNSASYSTISLTGTFNITVEATDNTGKSYTKIINNVVFGELTIADISNLSCTGQTCSFAIPGNKLVSTISIRIGSQNSSSTCNIVNTPVTCQNINLPQGQVDKLIYLKINSGVFQSTGLTFPLVISKELD